MLNEHFVNFGGAAIPVRGSVGITKFDKRDDSVSIIAHADQAMYQKKHENARELRAAAIRCCSRRMQVNPTNRPSRPASSNFAIFGAVHQRRAEAVASD